MCLRSNSSLNDFLGDGFQSVPVGFMISVEYREVESICSVDLNVHISWAKYLMLAACNNGSMDRD